jgi:hypothetical protein
MVCSPRAGAAFSVRGSIDGIRMGCETNLPAATCTSIWRAATCGPAAIAAMLFTGPTDVGGREQRQTPMLKVPYEQA